MEPDTTPTDAPALAAFLFHLKRGYLPAAECDLIERITMGGPGLDELRSLDPYTLASAESLAHRLLAAQPVDGGDAHDAEPDSTPTP